MKEKIIFFTLFIVAAGLFISSQISKDPQSQVSIREERLQKKLAKAAEIKPIAPERVDIDKIQNLVAFSAYENMLRRSPFFKVQPKQTQAKEKTKIVPVAVEDKTPIFLYKGKILLGKREAVLIEQTRLGEVSMVSEGDLIGDYKVLDISDTEVILSKQGKANIILRTIEGP